MSIYGNKLPMANIQTDIDKLNEAIDELQLFDNIINEGKNNEIKDPYKHDEFAVSASLKAFVAKIREFLKTIFSIIKNISRSITGYTIQYRIKLKELNNIYYQNMTKEYTMNDLKHCGSLKAIYFFFNPNNGRYTDLFFNGFTIPNLLTQNTAKLNEILATSEGFLNDIKKVNIITDFGGRMFTAASNIITTNERLRITVLINVFLDAYLTAMEKANNNLKFYETVRKSIENELKKLENSKHHNLEVYKMEEQYKLYIKILTNACNAVNTISSISNNLFNHNYATISKLILSNPGESEAIYQ